jgi:hypothetical protein
MDVWVADSAWCGPTRLTDPLSFVQDVALLADGSEVVGEEGLKRIGVSVQLGLVEGLMQPMAIEGHQQILPDRKFMPHRGTRQNCASPTVVLIIEM